MGGSTSVSAPSGSLGDRHARRVSIVAPIQIPSFDSRVIREITHLATDNILAVSDVVRYDNEALRTVHCKNVALHLSRHI